uniref:Uncharacterized protein n=1 Tax=Calidris pygmaea TaxID=425635 RepID=A0A8C3JR28_9CHAR
MGSLGSSVTPLVARAVWWWPCGWAPQPLGAPRDCIWSTSKTRWERGGNLLGVVSPKMGGSVRLGMVRQHSSAPIMSPKTQPCSPNQGLAIHHLCRTNHPPEWLRGPVAGSRGLRGLQGTMARMSQALQDITRHQRDLNPPGAEILRRLASTHLKVRGLLSNLKGLFPAPSPHPGRRPRPTAPTKVFQQKLEGCRILWSYARFMAKLNTQLEARSRRARREKQRSRRGSHLPARS